MLGTTTKASMATTIDVAAVYGEGMGRTLGLIPNPGVRCPCCGDIVQRLPALRTIEPCQRCRRPLTLVRIVRRPKHYRLCNVIDLVSSAYGLVTMLIVLSFVLSEMNPRTFAKAVTVLLFAIGSLLLVDGALSMRTAIDRTWQTTSSGLVARALGFIKTISGVIGIALVMVGLRI